MGVKITVTQADIDEGEHGDAQECAVALAVSRTLHVLEFDSEWCSIGIQTLGFLDEGVFRSIPLPEHVLDFTRRFDAREDIDPFVFILDYTGTGSGFGTAPLEGEVLVKV